MPEPPVALSMIVTLPLEVAVIVPAVVFDTSTAPLPPLSVSEPLAPVRLSELTVELTPLAPLRLIDEVALSPLTRVIEPPVELRLILGAVMKLSPASVIPLAWVILTVPVPALVALVAKPSVTAPVPAVSDMRLAAVRDVAVVKLLLVDTVRLSNVAPEEERLKPAAVVLATLAVPVVLSVKLDVARFKAEIDPEAVSVRETVPVAVKLPVSAMPPIALSDRV